MSTSTISTLLPPEAGPPRVRLDTLVNLRWLAVVGQGVTVAVAALALDLTFPLVACLLVIGASIVANLAATTLNPPNHRLTVRGAFIFILFDLVQLTALLFLTGGLHNPFAVLFLAPVTISATALTLRATLTLAAIALTLISLVGGYHMPLGLPDGGTLQLEQLQLVGIWVAIVVGMLFLSGFAYRLTRETEGMSRALLATQTALAREQKLHDLSGVVAAAAHELGTPLATIKLVSSELVEELGDAPELRQDAELIREQADRCRDILRSMGRAGKSDRQMRTAPLAALIREAAEPHSDRGIEVVYDIAAHPGADGAVPLVRRSPEIIHGLRNMVQNAVDFARDRVWIDVRWSDDAIQVHVADDGPGFPPEMMPRLGDPFLRSRARERESYDGMGLGLFISKTLLERTGAGIAFANGTRVGQPRPGTRAGAWVTVSWPRTALEAPGRQALGANEPILG